MKTKKTNKKKVDKTTGHFPKYKTKMKRTEHPYPNLEPKLNTRKRQELIEADYLDQLTKTELAFLDKFNNETINASFKKVDGKFKGNLHKKPSLKTCSLH